jgi:hypothetical protein
VVRQRHRGAVASPEFHAQRWPAHKWLQHASYLYYFFDRKAQELLPPPERSYVDYILQDFAPGSAEWSEFERVFHAFATRAAQLAKRRIMLLYPQVPYRDRYPLQPVHDRMTAMARRHTLSIPPAAWTRSAGTLAPDAAAQWHQALVVPANVTTAVVETAEYVALPGPVDVQVTLALTDATGAGSHVAALEVVDAASNQPLVAEEIRVREGQGFQTIPLHVVVPGDELRGIKWRVRSLGHGSWKLASLAVTVDYGIEVINLAERLNRFNTHASAFDAHPNEAAHRVMADVAYQALTGGRP